MSLYIAGVMGVFKPLLNYGMKETRVDGLPILLDILERGADRDRGLITIRWTLGAADILFTNRFISPLFENGQVIKP
ncbi:hypothetical protein H4Q26_007511 [Puccinia striiformis f. sp. tritici PST-130]|nr:hypothetical protein H4Q26_007511 [Puccinia striiformis f. sp. tritici PST-130]